MTTKEKADALSKHIRGEKVKKHLEELIGKYQESKDNPAELLDIKDEFNQLGFYLGELYAKAKDVYSEATLESQNKFNEKYIEERGQLQENGRPKSQEDCKYSARLKTIESYHTEYLSELNYTMLREYKDTCRSFRDAAVQRIAIMRDDLFSSRQQV